MNEDTALVALSHAAFKSAFVYDMASVTRLAHAAGALMLWDLDHSAGAMPAGPGGFRRRPCRGLLLQIPERRAGRARVPLRPAGAARALRNPIAGWFGQRDPFAFGLEYEAVEGVRRFLTGTPPVVSLALIEPGVDLLLEAGMERVRAKSVRQTAYLIDLWEALLAPLGFELRSPRDALARGSHVSLGHPEGYRISQALVRRMRVVPDFRHPDNIRLGVSPLYTTYAEIRAAATALPDRGEGPSLRGVRRGPPGRDLTRPDGCRRGRVLPARGEEMSGALEAATSRADPRAEYARRLDVLRVRSADTRLRTSGSPTSG